MYKQEPTDELAENQEKFAIIRLQGHRTWNLISTILFFKDRITNISKWQKQYFTAILPVV